MEFQRTLGGILQHEFHPGHSQDIGNFVGVGDSGDSPMGYRRPRKLGGDQHRALDVNVAIDETWVIIVENTSQQAISSLEFFRLLPLWALVAVLYRRKR